VQTYYHHSIRYANDDYARLDIEIEKVEFYRDGHYLGEVHRIPESLSHIEATLYNDGEVHFDRDLFVVGSPGIGFEMVSTRDYDGVAGELYQRSDILYAGSVDFRDSRVRPLRYSRLFDPDDFDGYVPISLLPRDASWLNDYDDDSIGYTRPQYELYGRTSQGNVSTGLSFKGDASIEASNLRPKKVQTTLSFKTRKGAEVQLRRESEIGRIE